MILKGSQRSGGRALAAHLLNMRENDHVEVHAIEGFIADDLTGALLEIEAISKATRCEQPFFSLSLSPPIGAVATTADFENAIEQAAEKLGMAGQQRIVVFHEKDSRKHCHLVISRIGPDVKAINLPFFKERMRELSRELYLVHGWDLPKGHSDPTLTDPTNFSLEEWQTAKRAKRDPREIKAVLKQAWAQSDGRPAFAAALKERGFWLCQGDRGFIAIDYQDNIYSLSRWLDTKPKALRERLGDPQHLPTIEACKAEIAASISGAAQRFLTSEEDRLEQAMSPLQEQRRRIVLRQRQERTDLRRNHELAAEAAAKERSLLLRKGLRGLWDWVTGRRRAMINAAAVQAAELASAHEAEREVQRQKHLEERAVLQKHIVRVRQQREKLEDYRRSLGQRAHDLDGAGHVGFDYPNYRDVEHDCP